MRQEIIYEKNNIAVLQITGQIEYEDRQGLNSEFQKLDEQDKKIIIIDLGSMNYIGSAGIGVIAQYHKRLKARGGQLHLLNVQPDIRKIFNNIGLGERLNFNNGSYEQIIKEVS